MIGIVECLNAQGRSPYKQWFDALDPQAAAIVTVAVERLADGNTSRVKSIGEGAAEVRIDRGPGYRIYFGWAAKRSLYCSAAAPNAVSSVTSPTRSRCGGLTRRAR